MKELDVILCSEQDKNNLNHSMKPSKIVIARLTAEKFGTWAKRIWTGCPFLSAAKCSSMPTLQKNALLALLSFLL